MRFPLAAALSSVLLFTSIARADPILYGGNGGHPNIDGTPLSIHNGWLVGIDQDTGTVVPIGHPDDVARISGIAFASYDLLYGATLGGGGFPDTPPPPNSSRLVLINPNTGALVSDFGLIRAGVGGQGISIADLAIQPGTGVLYGIESREAAGAKSLRPCRPRCSTPPSPLMEPMGYSSAGPVVGTRFSVEISSRLTL